jgi:heterodisulfide reductase subunit A-like polyferredoxin
MTITIKPKTVEISGEVDVLVVGGGPAGIGAAVSAARRGAKTMLLEKRGFLGGNITAS